MHGFCINKRLARSSCIEFVSAHLNLNQRLFLYSHEFGSLPLAYGTLETTNEKDSP